MSDNSIYEKFYPLIITLFFSYALLWTVLANVSRINEHICSLNLPMTEPVKGAVNFTKFCYNEDIDDYYMNVVEERKIRQNYATYSSILGLLSLISYLILHFHISISKRLLPYIQKVAPYIHGFLFSVWLLFIILFVVIAVFKH